MSLTSFASLFLTLHLIEGNAQTRTGIIYPSLMMVDSLCHPNLKQRQPKVDFKETVEVIPMSPNKPSSSQLTRAQRKRHSKLVKFLRRSAKRLIKTLDVALPPTESVTLPRRHSHRSQPSRTFKSHHGLLASTRHPQQQRSMSTISTSPTPSSPSTSNLNRKRTNVSLPRPSRFSPSGSMRLRSRRRSVRTWSSIERLARNPQVMELNRIAMRDLSSDASRAVQSEQGMIGLQLPYDNSAWDVPLSWFRRMEIRILGLFKPYGVVGEETWLVQPESTPADPPEIVIEYWEGHVDRQSGTQPQGRVRGRRRSICSWLQQTHQFNL
ncbi:hypothetical protein FRB91_010081 [Serendipita sp. 411]|nr:hypothetical protein FRB91_010081 [Serendipita sp. 411]